MSIESIFNWILAAQAFELGLLIKHMFDCRRNSERLTRIEDWIWPEEIK
jgi:uncharacterized membrane protein